MMLFQLCWYSYGCCGADEIILSRSQDMRGSRDGVVEFRFNVFHLVNSSEFVAIVIIWIGMLVSQNLSNLFTTYYIVIGIPGASIAYQEAWNNIIAPSVSMYVEQTRVSNIYWK